MKTWVSNTVKVGVLSTGFLLAAGTAAHASGSTGHYTEGNHYAARAGAAVQLGTPVKTGVSAQFLSGRGHSWGNDGDVVVLGGGGCGGGCGGGSIFGGGCGGGLLNTGGVLLSTRSSCDDGNVVILGDDFGDNCDDSSDVFLTSFGGGHRFGSFGGHRGHIRGHRGHHGHHGRH
jgi:hypothetical protein